MRAMAWLFFCWIGVATADQGTAFEQGKALGGAVSSSAFSGINNDAAKAVPAYGANPAETQYFQSGQGQLAGPGVAKMQACANATPGADKIANQECAAVNFLAQNPQARPQFTITKNDPMILGAKSARNNAESFFQTLGLNGGTGSATPCTTTTETTPPHYETQTCSTIRAVDTQQCTLGRVINIDTDANFQCARSVTALTSANRSPSLTTPSCTMGRIVNIDTDANFQCEQTVNAYETLNCTRASTPSVTLAQNCVNGNTYSVSGLRDGYVAIDEVTLDYVCNSAQTSGPIPIQIYAHGSRGACIGPQTFNVSFDSVTGWIDGPELSPHWQGSCQPMNTQYRVSQACSAANPNCEVQLYWWQEYCATACPADACIGDSANCLDCITFQPIAPVQTCVTYRTGTLTLDFLHPSQWVPQVSAADNCAALEARAQ